ncbi:MAG: acyltransferase family protein [Candidatus Eiseniibacteriota bacterium]
MTQSLADHAGGRDNNFNLIRLFAASCVLFGHSFPISGADPSSIGSRIGPSFSAGGVDVFFALSGYLVTASLFSRRAVRDFVRARVLRIYPVLIAASFGGAFVIGPLATRLERAAYLSSWETWHYALQNAFLIWPLGTQFTLPGVFESTPIARAVNGSLWTLPWELTMYVMLALGGLVAFRSRLRGALGAVRGGLVGFAALSSVALELNGTFHFASDFRSVEGLRFFSLFTGGAAFQILRERIALRWPLAVVSAAALALVQWGHGRCDLIYAPAVAYAVLWLGYVPGGWLRAYNRLGDYSYGLYAYAFPIEQLVVDRVPGIPAAGLLAAAGPATLACAVLSWHVLENRCLKLKSRPRAGAAPARGEAAPPASEPAGPERG